MLRLVLAVRTPGMEALLCAAEIYHAMALPLRIPTACGAAQKGLYCGLVVFVKSVNGGRATDCDAYSHLDCAVKV